MTPVEIEVHADPVCPWCYIGKRRLDRALVLVGGDVAIIWRAYQLNPLMPPDGMDRAVYLAAKFGGAGRAKQVYDVIRREGAAEGIAFDFARIRRTPNTLAAHRLVRFAAAKGTAGALMDRLFAAYFTEGADIGDRATLATLAAETGLDAEAVRAFLAGDAERDAVLEEDRAVRISGIAGVPHFVVDGRYALPGAQSPEVIARTIELARASLPRGAAVD